MCIIHDWNNIPEEVEKIVELRTFKTSVPLIPCNATHTLHTRINAALFYPGTIISKGSSVPHPIHIENRRPHMMLLRYQYVRLGEWLFCADDTRLLCPYTLVLQECLHTNVLILPHMHWLVAKHWSPLNTHMSGQEIWEGSNSPCHESYFTLPIHLFLWTFNLQTIKVF